MFAVDSDDDEVLDDVVDTDVPDELVKILLDFFSDTPLCDATEQ